MVQKLWDWIHKSMEVGHLQLIFRIDTSVYSGIRRHVPSGQRRNDLGGNYRNWWSLFLLLYHGIALGYCCWLWFQVRPLKRQRRSRRLDDWDIEVQQVTSCQISRVVDWERFLVPAIEWQNPTITGPTQPPNRITTQENNERAYSQLSLLRCTTELQTLLWLI